MGPAAAAALVRSHHAAPASLKRENGWLFTTKTGLYGTDYLQRAFITAVGLGANRPQDAVYPMSQRASLLEAYEGGQQLHAALRERTAAAGQGILVAHHV